MIIKNKRFGVSNKIFAGVMVCIGALFVLANAARFAESTDGKVRDDEGVPVQGAIVMALWKANVGVLHSSVGCYHVQSAKTDTDGKFHFSKWWDGFDFKYFPTSGRHVIYRVYKPGYIQLNNPAVNDGDLMVQKYVGTKDQYFDNVLSASAAVGICESADYTGEIYHFAAPYASEMEAIADTSDQITVVDSLRISRDTALAKRNGATQ